MQIAPALGREGPGEWHMSTEEWRKPGLRAAVTSSRRQAVTAMVNEAISGAQANARSAVAAVAARMRAIAAAEAKGTRSDARPKVTKVTGVEKRAKGTSRKAASPEPKGARSITRVAKAKAAAPVRVRKVALGKKR